MNKLLLPAAALGCCLVTSTAHAATAVTPCEQRFIDQNQKHERLLAGDVINLNGQSITVKDGDRLDTICHEVDVLNAPLTKCEADKQWYKTKDDADQVTIQKLTDQYNNDLGEVKYNPFEKHWDKVLWVAAICFTLVAGHILARIEMAFFPKREKFRSK